MLLFENFNIACIVKCYLPAKQPLSRLNRIHGYNVCYVDCSVQVCLMSNPLRMFQSVTSHSLSIKVLVYTTISLFVLISDDFPLVMFVAVRQVIGTDGLKCEEPQNS